MLASGSIPLPPIPLKKTGESIILAPYWPGARGASGGDSRSLRRAPAKARSRSDRDDLGDQLVCGFSREVRSTGALHAGSTPDYAAARGVIRMRPLYCVAIAAALISVPLSVSIAQPVPAATAPADDARLTAFLDAEFAEDLKLRPQLA